MNNQGLFQNRFLNYLSQKMKPEQAEEIVFKSYSQRHRNSCQSFISEDCSQTESLSSRTSSSCLTLDSSALEVDWSMPSQSGRKSNGSQCRTATMKKRRLVKMRDLEENACSICLDLVRERASLPCQHSYCHECLLEWLKNSSKCPYCRFECSYYTVNGQKYQIQEKEFEYEAPE